MAQLKNLRDKLFSVNYDSLIQYPWFLNLQFINLIIPLISYPYLLRTIGPTSFGLIAIANSIGNLVATFTEYGYGFKGTQEISRFDKDYAAISRYYSEAIVVRSLVYVVACSILIPLLNYLPVTKHESTLITLTLVGVFPVYFYPQWLFIGLQKVKQLNYILFFNKIFGVVLVFLVIKKEEDYSLFPLVNILPAAISAGWAVYYLRSCGISIKISHFNRSMFAALKKDKDNFISQSMTILYAQINPLLLGWVSHDIRMVGNYAIAERIVFLTRSAITPFNQMFLPVISKKFKISAVDAMEMGKKHAKNIAVLSIAAIAFLNLFSVPIVHLLAGSMYDDAPTMILILSPIILFIPLSNIAGIHILLNLERNKDVMKGLLFGGISHLIMIFTLAQFSADYSVAISCVLTEGLICALFFWSIKKYIHDVLPA